MADTGWS